MMAAGKLGWMEQYGSLLLCWLLRSVDHSPRMQVCPGLQQHNHHRRRPVSAPTWRVVIISCSSPAVWRPTPAARSRCRAASVPARCWRRPPSCRSSSLQAGQGAERCLEHTVKL